MAWRVCSTSGCPELHEGSGRCPACAAEGDKARRPDGNPYTTRGHRAFREAVLTRDPICVDCHRAHSTVADHDPIERRDLVDMGLDPNDPMRGRGRCKACHDRRTAATSPGGWNDRPHFVK